MTVTRGTSNGNHRGSSEARRRRKEWLLETYAADRKMIRVVFVYSGTDPIVSVDQFVITVEELRTYESVVEAEEVPTCRCYRCGKLLWSETLTVDRIIPHCKGGTYRRTNIRPACDRCNSETGGALSRGKEHQPAKKIAAKKRSKRVLVPT